MERRTSGQGSERARSRPWRARLAVVVGIGCVLVAFVAPPAGANYGRVEAQVGCDRSVDWVASASTEGTDEERTNNDVVVEYHAADDDGSNSETGDWLSAGPPGRFTAADDFRFSGSFDLPDDVDAVNIRITPRAAWGTSADGEAAGDPRFTRTELPAECADQALVADIDADCAGGGATVSIDNVGDSTETATIGFDSFDVRDVELAPGTSERLLVPTLDDHPNRLRVAAGDFVIAEREIDGDCSRAGPAAVVVESCTQHQAVVLARPGGPEPGAVETRVDGVIVNRTETDPDEVLRRTLELPDGTSEIEISIEGTVVSSGTVGGCDQPIAGTISCGTAGRPDCSLPAPAELDVPPPPPPPDSLSIEITDPLLPRTGPWERAIALGVGGLLLAAGGMALALQDRTRPRPSLIAAAVAPYRQRWWDDT